MSPSPSPLLFAFFFTSSFVSLAWMKREMKKKTKIDGAQNRPLNSPSPMHPPILRLLLVAALASTPATFAQQDAPAVDIGQLLQALKTIREQQAAQLKTSKQTAMQQISAVAGSAERASQLWEDAVRATQFDGMAKEGAQFRAWKEGEGEALKEREVQTAIHLHLTWLALTLQRSSGAPVKDMLPAVINYTKELAADDAAMEIMADNIKREREAAAIAPAGGGNRRQVTPGKKISDNEIKKAHDAILKRALAASPVVKWMNLADAVTVPQWENNPGDFDGIFQNIVLPELRAQRDARVLEFWDIKLKKEADAASRTKLQYEIEKFNTQRRPVLLWNRAQEYATIGQKNRAISEMFALIKAYPTHPEADDWISKLETLIAPSAPAADPTAAPAPAAVPGL